MSAVERLLALVVVAGAAAEVVRRTARRARVVYLRRRRWRDDVLNASRTAAAATAEVAALRAEVKALSGAITSYVISSERRATGLQSQIDDVRTISRLRRADQPRHDPGTERRANPGGN